MRSSIAAGETFLPPLVTRISLLRPVITRKPASSTCPRSPVVSQPSSKVAAVDSSSFQVYAFFTKVREGADVEAVRDGLAAVVAEEHPRAEVVTQRFLRDTVANITARLVSAFEVFAWVMFVLAVLIGAATLASGLVERRRANALLRLSGGTASGVRGRLVAEVVPIAVGSVVVACMVLALLIANPGKAGTPLRDLLAQD